MPSITFSFSGTVKTDVEKVYSLISYTDIDVSSWSAEKLVDELKKGKVAVCFETAISKAEETADIELSDYSI